jgi:hypothetical protein
MNLLKIFATGTAVLTALVSIEAGSPSQPFKIGNEWFSITKVQPPK